jgi:hypothetical protein
MQLLRDVTNTVRAAPWFALGLLIALIAAGFNGLMVALMARQGGCERWEPAACGLGQRVAPVSPWRHYLAFLSGAASVSHLQRFPSTRARRLDGGASTSFAVGWRSRRRPR